MNDQELFDLWNQKRFESLWTDQNKDRLDRSISELDKFKKTISRRNMREIVVALILIPLFLYMAVVMEPLLSKIGAVLMVFAAIWIIYKLIAVSKTRIEPDANMDVAEYLTGWQRYLLNEKKLLEQVLSWYILPILIPAILFIYGFTAFSIWFLIELLILFGIAWLIFWINRKAIQIYIDPKIYDLEKTIELFSDPDFKDDD